MRVVKQFSVSRSSHNTPTCVRLKNEHANNHTLTGWNCHFLTCAYDPGPSPQIPSPPPWLSSSLTPYPVSMCRPISHYYFYCLFVMLRRRMAECSGYTGKTTNGVVINASPGSRRSKRTRQIFHNECAKAKKDLRVKRGGIKRAARPHPPATHLLPGVQ